MSRPTTSRRGGRDGRTGQGNRHRYYYVVLREHPRRMQGNHGSASVNPKTGKPYGSSFPRITVGDIVNAHRLSALQLGIERLRR